MVVPADSAIASPGDDQRGGLAAIAAFSARWRTDLAAKPGSCGRTRATVVAPPWTLRQEAALGQRLQVAADGHVGDAELGDEVADPYAAGRPDPVEDRRLTLLGEHQVTTALGRVNRTISNTGEHYPVIRCAQESDLYREC